MPRNRHQRPRRKTALTINRDNTTEKEKAIAISNFFNHYEKLLAEYEHNQASTIGIGFDTNAKKPELPYIEIIDGEEFEERRRKKKAREERSKVSSNINYKNFKYRLKKYKAIKEFKRKINEIANKLKVEGIEDGREIDFFEIKEFMNEEGLYKEEYIREKIKELQKNLETTMERNNLIASFDIILDKVQKFFKQNQQEEVK